MYIRKGLQIFATVIATALIAMGCGSDGNRRAAIERQSMDPPDLDAIYAKRFALEDFQERLQSAKNFYQNGNGFLYRTTRDSLVNDVNTYIRANPHAETDPDFATLLNHLSLLDTMTVDPAPPPPGDYASQEDSLALAFADWPEIDIELDDGVFSEYNTVFPTIENRRIDFWIRYFTGPGRSRFERAVYRMQLHRPLVEKILDEKDLPAELACVALIESGYSMSAVSYASAVGPWQFIRGTGKLYGLRQNWWYDERRDIVASTYAAANYLEDLHDIWGDWFLALAAYNCGEYRVARQIARQKSENFWHLQLPRQTQRYVPKFLAALYILRDPDKYDLDLPDVEPLAFDEVVVKDATDLQIIADCAETTVDIIKDLNPQCRRWATPPQMEVIIKVPLGKGELCAANLAAVPAAERVTYRRHKVKRGETLSHIADRYGVSISSIRSMNGIRGSMIREGRSLLVPVKGGTYAASSSGTSKPNYKNPDRNINKKALEKYAKRGAPPAGYKRLTYTVKTNDTLGEIAETYRTSARKLRAWNNLSYRRYIYPGQKLAIYVPESFDAPDAPVSKVVLPDATHYNKLQHVVKRGESFYRISKTYNVSVQELLAWNNKSARSIIRPGDVLHIWIKKR